MTTTNNGIPVGTDLVIPPIDPGELAPRLAPAPATTIIGLLDKAIERGMPAESLEKLFALYERMKAGEAAEQFGAALTSFQGKCKTIPKTSRANIATKNGGSYSYTYAELDEIAGVIRPLLAEHGLSYTWDSSEEGGRITCTCTVRHVGGHSASAKFSSSIDTAAPLSGPQKSAAALTFARRQSLMQALGLTTGDPDTDGAGGHGVSGDTITEKQAATLDDMIEDICPTERDRFLRYVGVERLIDLPASKFRDAVSALKQKKDKLIREGARR